MEGGIDIGLEGELEYTCEVQDYCHVGIYGMSASLRLKIRYCGLFVPR